MGDGEKEPGGGKLSFTNTDIEEFEKGKDELNLSEFPIAVVAEAARPGQLRLEFSDSIHDRSTGRMVERRMTVHATEEWGLPAAQDDEVMVGLLQLTYLAGWPKRIRFTRYQLCKLLRWSVGGASYRRIYRALHRFSTTTYNYRYGWRDKANQEWIPSLVFSYIQSLKIHEADRPTKSGLCEVTWSDDFHRSLESGNLKGLDFNRFVSLRSAIAKRLFRFLDKRFGLGIPRYSCDLHTLAFEKVGVSRSYGDAAQIKRLLLPAIRELERVGFLRAESPVRRFEKLGRGRWKAHFQPAPKLKKTGKKSVECPIEKKLIDLGIVPSEARKFVRDHPGDYLELKIDQFAFREVKSNPGGLLAETIRRDFAPPPGYRSPEQRAREAAEALERAQRKAAVTAEMERYWEAERAAEDREIARAELAFQALSKDKKKELEIEARKKFPERGRDWIYWTMIRLLRERLSQQ